MEIYDISKPFPLSVLSLRCSSLNSNRIFPLKTTPPQNNNNRAHHSQQQYPLYIQTPKCNTKQGFTGKRSNNTTDLLFSKEENGIELFLKWMEQMVEYAQNMLYTQQYEDLTEEDIDNWFVSPFKAIKSGKIYALRVSYLPNVFIYDENQNVLGTGDILPETEFICILEIIGVKCSSNSFSLEIEIKQIMVLTPPPPLPQLNLNQQCLLLGANTRATTPPTPQVASVCSGQSLFAPIPPPTTNTTPITTPLTKNHKIYTPPNQEDITMTTTTATTDGVGMFGPVADNSYPSTTADNDIELYDIQCDPTMETITLCDKYDDNDTDDDTDADTDSYNDCCEEGADEFSECYNNTQINATVSLPSPPAQPQAEQQNEIEEITEITDNEDTTTPATVHIKNRYDIYLKMYKETKQKAKHLYLEAKQIKDLYLHDLVENDDDEHDNNENGY